MKKELREEIKKTDKKNEEKLSKKDFGKYENILKAVGIASLVGLTGYSAAKLLKDKKFMKKVSKGDLVKAFTKKIICSL